jgi:hypothetical protein
MTMGTLKDIYADVYSDLKTRGYDGIARMMEVMGKSSEIDKALGFNAATSHWMNGKNAPSWASERKALMWVKENLSPDCSPVPEVAVEAVSDATDNDLFLAIIPPAKIAKATRLMGLIGIELVEIEP